VRISESEHVDVESPHKVLRAELTVEESVEELDPGPKAARAVVMGVRQEARDESELSEVRNEEQPLLIPEGIKGLEDVEFDWANAVEASTDRMAISLNIAIESNERG